MDYSKEGKISGLSVAAFIISLLGGFIIVSLIMSIIDLAKNDGRKKGLSIAALIISILWLAIGICACGGGLLGGSSGTTNGNDSLTTQDAENEEESNDDSNIEVKTSESQTDSDDQISGADTVVTKEQYISECETYDYKELARYPDTYKGKKMKLVVHIEQIVSGGFLDKNSYYRAYTKGDYSLWMGDEYFLYDYRTDDTTKILVEDYLVVYGEYNGTVEVKRALTGTTDEIPSINVYYAEFIDEDTANEKAVESKPGNEEIFADNNIDVEFDGFKIAYDGYEISKDYDGNKVIIVFFNFTNNNDEAKSPGTNCSIKAYQDGIECDDAYIFDGPEEVNNRIKDVKKGATIRYAEVYKIKSDSEIEIEVSKFFGDLQDKMTITIE